MLPIESHARIAQPEPWIVVATAVKWAMNLSNEPNWSSIAWASSPTGLSPPSGDRFRQNAEWLTWPPRLNASVFSRPITEPKSPESRAPASFSSVWFAAVMYAWWCLSWCSCMIRPEMCGSSAA